jgi:hypothetical protein
MARAKMSHVRISLRHRNAAAILAVMTIAGRLNLLRRFDRPVRCRSGHLFTTIWMPFGSLKAVRLGRRRIQRCPIGHHWTTVVRIDARSATASELEAAAAVHDVHIP